MTGDRIAAIGDLSTATATRVIEADGLILAPGFIDLHSHADVTLWRSGPSVGLNNLTQGVTTIVVGQDGRSGWPAGSSVAGTIDAWEQEGLTENVVLLVGFGSVRRRVLGLDDRPATEAERHRMRLHVRSALEQGALGISTGLGYTPDRFADTDELSAVIQEVSVFDGIHISHLRDQGDRLLESLEELIEIAERTGVTSVATHFKAVLRSNYGKSEPAMTLLEQARERGLPVFVDQYPYATSSNGIAVSFLPSRVRFELGRDRDLRERLRRATPEALVRMLRPSNGGGGGERHDDAVLSSLWGARTRDALRSRIEYMGGPDTYRVERAPDPRLEGQTLDEVARLLQLDVVEAAIVLDLLGAQVTHFHISEADIETIMRSPFTATSSDGTWPRFGFSVVHPRSYGSFPRKLRRYVYERGVLSLEDAVRSMTGLAADILGLDDRGYIRTSYAADLVLFDPGRIRDLATYSQPHRYSEGVVHLIVNGTPVLVGGEFTGSFPGRVLRRSSAPRPEVPRPPEP